VQGIGVRIHLRSEDEGMMNEEHEDNFNEGDKGRH
jgi:hypothetical protein